MTPTAPVTNVEVAVTPIPDPIEDENNEDNSLDTAELILICLGGAIVVITILLVSFMCYDKYCNAKIKQGNKTLKVETKEIIVKPKAQQ